MVSPPPCAALGAQCRELPVTLRIAELKDDGPVFHDAIGTWLMGHRERITFGRPYVRGKRLLVDGTLHVACRYLRLEHTGKPPAARTVGTSEPATCAAHRMRGRVPASTRPDHRPPLVHADGTVTLVHDRRVQAVPLAAPPAPRRSLPLVATGNPCAGAPCRTADNRRGAACCRDLTAEVVIPADEIEDEALLRARVSPYVCKVNRADVDIVECEIISACSYLSDDDFSCRLHGLLRENGAPAKPSICSDWPGPGGDPDATFHPGCRLAPVTAT